MFAYCRNNPASRTDVYGFNDIESNTTILGEDEDELAGPKGAGANNSAQNSSPVIQADVSSCARSGVSGGNPSSQTGNSSGFGQAPKQGAPGSTYTQYSSDGQNSIVSQTTYGEYGAPSQRIDYQGRDHKVGLPHVHEFSWRMINDKVCPAGERIYRLMQI